MNGVERSGPAAEAPEVNGVDRPGPGPRHPK